MVAQQIFATSTGSSWLQTEAGVIHEVDDTDVSMSTCSRIGGVPETLQFNLNGRTIDITMERRGPEHGPLWLLLPALSTVSSRGEWHALANAMDERCQLVSFDWPGFGDSERPAMTYNVNALRQVLAGVLQQLQRSDQGQITVVAAGHSAPIALGLAEDYSQQWAQLVLVAPTFRGPLPTMTGQSGQSFNWVRRLVELPLIGPILYRLNTSRAILKLMLRRHVWVNRNLLTPQRVREQQKISRQPGARFASVAFVTGGLDAASDSQWWLTKTQQLHCPLHVVLANEAPPRSKQEMLTLADSADRVSDIDGRLGLHEEFGRLLAETISAG